MLNDTGSRSPFSELGKKKKPGSQGNIFLWIWRNTEVRRLIEFE